MVFELVSNVHSISSIMEIPCSTKLYTAKVVDVEIANPFDKNVTYDVKLLYHRNTKAQGTKKQS